MTEQLVIDRPQELPEQHQPQPEPQPKPAPAAAVGNVSEIVQQLKQERERVQKEIQTLDAAITALGSNSSNAQPLQPTPQSVPVTAHPAQTKPEPAPVAGRRPDRNNPQPAPGAVQSGQSKQKPAPANAKPARSMARRIHCSVGCHSNCRGRRIWRLRVFFYTPPMSPNIVPSVVQSKVTTLLRRPRRAAIFSKSESRGRPRLHWRHHRGARRRAIAGTHRASASPSSASASQGQVRARPDCGP